MIPLKYLKLVLLGCLLISAGEIQAKETFASAVKALKAHHFADRRGAATYLGNLKDRRAVVYLVDALADKDNSVVKDVIEALIKINDPRAIEPITKILFIDDFTTAEMAAAALGHFKSPKSVKPLLDILGASSDEDFYDYTQAAAADALGEIGDVNAEAALIKALNYTQKVKYAATRALGHINGPKSQDALFKVFKESKDPYLKKLALHSLEEIGFTFNNKQDIAQYLFLSHEYNKLTSILGEEGAINFLLEESKDNLSFESKNGLVNTLAEVGGSKIVNKLIDYIQLTSTEVESRNIIIRTLGKIKDPRATLILTSFLEDDKSELANGQVVFAALGEIGDPRAVAPLLRYIDKRSLDHVDIDTLSNYKDAQSIKTITGKLNDYLRNWKHNKDVANILRELKWKPTTRNEKVHFWLANRDSEMLKQNWGMTKAVLLSDIDTNNYIAIENSLYGFIGIGKSEIIDTLVKKISKQGSKELAEAYINCGKSELVSAGEEWAKVHGYSINTGNGFSSGGWGEM